MMKYNYVLCGSFLLSENIMEKELLICTSSFVQKCKYESMLNVKKVK